jgi:ATP-dependent Clp protease ATP-binding subunit ClpA
VQGEVMRELERRFPPEFRNRIDEVVLFSPLTRDEVRSISMQYLAQVTLALAKAGKTIRVTDEALEALVSRGYSLAFGARFLKRVIDEAIKLPISARWHEGSHFEVLVEDGAIAVTTAPATIPSSNDVIVFGDVA